MSSENVLIWPGITDKPLPVSVMLDKAPRDMQSVVIIGFDKDDNFFFSSSEADGGDVLWLLEMAKKRLMEAGDPDE